MTKHPVVIALYNNENEVHDFVFNVLLTQSISPDCIYIVLNAGSVDWVHPSIKILHPEGNLGYLGALRYVIEKENPDFDYITLCNTDLSFQKNNFLADYEAELQKSEFAVAGPRIFSTVTKSEQNPIYTERLTRSKLKRLVSVFNNYFFYLVYQTLFYGKRMLTTKGAVSDVKTPYALHGSFITISSRYFEKRGTLNYPVLLLGEELFLAEEALRVGLKNLFVPGLKITHNEHSTTGIYKSKEQVKLMKESIVFILKNYYGGK